MRTAKVLSSLLAAALAGISCAEPRLPPLEPGPPPAAPPRANEAPPSPPPARQEIGQLPEGEEPGQDTEVVIEALGFQNVDDVFRAHEVLAAIPGVHLARHEGTTFADGAPAGSYRIHFHGDPEQLIRLATEVRWQSGAKSVRLKREAGFRFRAVYD